MYTILECLVVAGLVLAVGAMVFMVASVMVLLHAGAKGLASISHQCIRSLRRVRITVWTGRQSVTVPLSTVDSKFEGQVETREGAREIFVD